MSTSFGSVKGIEPYMPDQGKSVHVNRFFGGKENGVCIQLTPEGGRYICLDRKGVRRLRRRLKKAMK